MDSSPVSGRLDIFEIYRRFCEIRSSQGLCNNIYKPPYEASSPRANYLKEALTQLLTLVENKFQARWTSRSLDAFMILFSSCAVRMGRRVLSYYRWKLVLVGRFRLLNHLCKNQRHNITEDTWQQVLVFSRCVHENLEGYDSQGASPVLIDEFVEQMYSILGPRKNTSLSCNCGDRESESCLYEDPLSASQGFSPLQHGLRSVPGLKRKTSKDYDEEEVSENEYAFSSPNMKRIRSEDSPGCSSKTHCAIERSLSQGFATMEEDNQEKQLEDGGSSSLFKTCFNALNAFSVPYSLARGGWLSLSLLLLLAATAFYTSLLITKCMNADRSIKTYPDIGERAFGKPGRIIVSVFMHLELYLVTTGFLIMEGDNLHNLFPGFNIKMIGLRLNGKQSFMASVALVIMPTLWWDNLSVLSYVSMSGVLATVLTLGSISWVGAVDGIGFRQSGKLINWSGIPTALSLYAFCYGAHPVLPTLYNSMKSKHQFNNVLLISFILCTIGYTSMAVLGYLMYGSNTLSQITLNLPTHKTSSKVAIYTTLVNPIAKYALMITPTVNTIKDCFLRKTYLHLLISTLCIASSVVIAETFPFFGYMMSLVGALLSVTVSILLPCLCYLKISGSFKKFGFETIMLFGMVAMCVPIGVLGTYIAIRELVISV
ncbi:hypothetical protein HID58_091466 [Brassica napus]|uniref:Amino acid transporter transmembrane domain-containing protein n=1 Tax=Brassica napus TaxID=3708 RepID=A0ABQ7X239_BRANA|nr:hypothetical protein HID58_091466 [Brassica napus]